MESLRKWFYKPKRDDKSLLAQFFFADEALNLIASELDSFDGRKDPERCTTLVNMLRQSQDRVLTITNAIMDVLIPDDRANRDFRVKFPEDVLQENLAGQLWFGAECLAAGSSIMNREVESAAMRPLAKALTKSLETVRDLLREACLRNNTPNGPLRLPNNEYISESLKIFDRLFAEFELCYVSAMVPVKTTQEYELQELITVLFSETLHRALKMKLLTQEMVDDYDPALMFTIPRLAIVSGLIIFPNGPLCIDKPVEQMSEMFRPFKTLLHKIRELLWTLNKRELYMLEKLLCDNEQIADVKSVTDMNSVNDHDNDLDDFVNTFYNDYPLCKDFVSSFYTVTVNDDSETEIDLAKEAAEISKSVKNKNTIPVIEATNTADSMFPDYETISDTSLPDEASPKLVDEESTLIDSFSKLGTPVIMVTSNETPPLDEVLSNIIESSDYPMQRENGSESKLDRQLSENIEIPSTSGYLLANTVTYDSIAASMSELEHNQARDDSLPDRDSLETISAATATLSTLLMNTKQQTDRLQEDCKNDDIKSDCLYCEEHSNSSYVKQECVKNDSESPMDSGISTENTSLDRSPSLDLEKQKDSETKVCSVYETKDNNNLENSSASNATVTTIPCQCSVDCVKNLKMNYAEPKLVKSEACDTSRTCSNKQNGDSFIPSTSKKCLNSSPHLKRRINNSTPRHRKRSHQRPSVFKDKMTLAPEDNLSVCSSETSSFNSECADDEEIALAMQAAEIANRNEARAKFRSSEDLVHRLFVCIAGVADQLQTNFASDLRNILKSVFLMNSSDSNPEPQSPPNNIIESSIEYRAQESDILSADEFSIDPNILAQEALFDSNIYFQADNETHRSNDESVEEITSQPEETSVLSRPITNGLATVVNHTFGEPSEPVPDGGNDDDDNRSNYSVPDRPPAWIPDIEAPKCMSCEANFTVVKRRHHCRNCGKVFCARCSANSVPLPKYGHNKPVRVCNKCFMYNLTPFTM